MRLFLGFLSFILIFSSFTNSIGQEIEGLNNKQPIYIGDTIYTARTAERYGYAKTIAYSNIEISYTYLGIDNGSIQIDYRLTFYRNSLDPSKVEYRTLILPINAQKQAYLRIKTLNRSEPYKDLIITVLDGFNRIVVKVVKVIPIAGPAGY